MTNRRLAVYWIRMAVVYFLIGVVLGNVMGASHDFSLRTVHAHLNLLGWVSMALSGLLLRMYADALGERLAAIQFWLHQTAAPVMFGALAGVVKGHGGLAPLLGIAGTAVALSVIVLVINVWRNLKPAH